MDNLLVNNDRTTRAEPYTKQLGGCTGRGFMPGVSGNPRGRPKGASFTDRALAFLGGEDGKDLDELVKAVIRRALEGDATSLKELLARIDPAPNHNININNNVNIVNDAMFGFLEKVRAYTHSLKVDEVEELKEGISDNPTADS